MYFHVKIKVVRFNYILLSLLFFLNSCNYLPFRNKEAKKELDTIVNYSRVDESPAFQNCKQLLGKERADCFRQELQKEIVNVLNVVDFMTDEDIDEEVNVYLVVSKTGKVELKKIEASTLVLEKLPVLDSLLKASIKQLPNLDPALKRGIPVAVQYKLPIKIQVEEQ